jgi:hypothetical protein
MEGVMTNVRLLAAAAATIIALTTPAFAKDPLIGGKSQPIVVGDKDLASVKGSGYYAEVYGYYGSYYSSYATLYGAIGTYYQLAGYGSPSTSYYYYAYVYSSAATNDFYTAYRYASLGE